MCVCVCVCAVSVAIVACRKTTATTTNNNNETMATRDSLNRVAGGKVQDFQDGLKIVIFSNRVRQSVLSCSEWGGNDDDNMPITTSNQGRNHKTPAPPPLSTTRDSSYHIRKGWIKEIVNKCLVHRLRWVQQGQQLKTGIQ